MEQKMKDIEKKLRVIKPLGEDLLYATHYFI